MTTMKDRIVTAEDKTTTMKDKTIMEITTRKDEITRTER